MDDISRQRKMLISQLVNIRREKNITQSELAGMLGTQSSNISRFESGNQNPSLDMIFRIAEALGKDLNFVLEEKLPYGILADTYSLRIFDTELVKFRMRKRGLEGLIVEILDINEEQRHRLPLDLVLTDKGLLEWLDRRVIPKNRTFVEEILEMLDLDQTDTKGIIDVCKGLSLNDSYWVVPSDFKGKFKLYNLYENRFSEMLALVAYTGAGYSNEVFTTSPELTTNGMLPKAWRLIEEDGIYLYKGGTSGGYNTGREPYCEYYASQIAERMGLNAVHYDLENWKGILASKCELFTDINTSYIPIGRIVKSGGINACVAYYDKYGKDFSEQIRSMLVFDALTFNQDRHYGNFGILRDNESGKVIAPAPIFDNGFALFPFAGHEDLESLDTLLKYARSLDNPYRMSYNEICKYIMGPIQKEQLRKMINFKFERHPSINLPEKHLQLIEEVINIRVNELLEIPLAR